MYDCIRNRLPEGSERDFLEILPFRVPDHEGGPDVLPEIAYGPLELGEYGGLFKRKPVFRVHGRPLVGDQFECRTGDRILVRQERCGIREPSVLLQLQRPEQVLGQSPDFQHAFEFLLQFLEEKLLFLRGLNFEGGMGSCQDEPVKGGPVRFDRRSVVSDIGFAMKAIGRGFALEDLHDQNRSPFEVYLFHFEVWLRRDVVIHCVLQVQLRPAGFFQPDGGPVVGNPDQDSAVVEIREGGNRFQNRGGIPFLVLRKSALSLAEKTIQNDHIHSPLLAGNLIAEVA